MPWTDVIIGIAGLAGLLGVVRGTFWLVERSLRQIEAEARQEQAVAALEADAILAKMWAARDAEIARRRTLMRSGEFRPKLGMGCTWTDADYTEWAETYPELPARWLNAWASHSVSSTDINA